MPASPKPLTPRAPTAHTDPNMGKANTQTKQLAHAQQEERRVLQLRELAYLLGQHPEVARILDLVEEVRA